MRRRVCRRLNVFVNGTSLAVCERNNFAVFEKYKSRFLAKFFVLSFLFVKFVNKEGGARMEFTNHNNEVSYNQEKKDKREWAIMRLFQSNFPAFPIGRLEKSERPDFLLYAKKKLIGIELTELKYERKDLEFNLRAHEDYLSEIMSGAQEIFERQSDQILVVDVHFKNELGPSVAMPRDQKSCLIKQGFIERIARIVMDNVPESTGTKYVIDRMSKYGDLNLPSKIEEIHVQNVTGRMTEGLWYAGISTKVKPLSVQSVSQRIEAKNEKLRCYNPECTEDWLIIIQNSFLMSSFYDPNTAREALQHRYYSEFDRVFVFERSEGQVTELKLRVEKGCK